MSEIPLSAIYVEQCTLRSIKPNSQVVALLERCRRHSDLEELDLSQNYVGPVGFMPIVEVIRRAPNLRFLSLADNRISNECLDALLLALLEARGDGSCSLSTLDLSRNPISHGAGKRLCQFVKSLASAPSSSSSAGLSISVENTLITPTLVMSIHDLCNQQRLSETFSDDADAKAAVAAVEHTREVARQMARDEEEFAAKKSQQQQQQQKQEADEEDEKNVSTTDKQDNETRVIPESTQEEQLQQTSAEENNDNATKEHVVGRTLSGNEDMMGRDRGEASDGGGGGGGGSALDFASYDNNESSTASEAPNRRPSSTMETRAPSMTTSINNDNKDVSSVAHNDDGGGGGGDHHDEQQDKMPHQFVLAPTAKNPTAWRPVFVGDDAESLIKPGSHHDRFVRAENSPFPALPLGFLHPSDQEKVLTDPSSRQYFVPEEFTSSQRHVEMIVEAASDAKPLPGGISKGRRMMPMSGDSDTDYDDYDAFGGGGPVKKKAAKKVVKKSAMVRQYS